MTIDELHRRLVYTALLRFRGNLGLSAGALGIKKDVLIRKILKYKMKNLTDLTTVSKKSDSNLAVSR